MGEVKGCEYFSDALHFSIYHIWCWIWSCRMFNTYFSGLYPIMTPLTARALVMGSMVVYGERDKPKLTTSLQSTECKCFVSWIHLIDSSLIQSFSDLFITGSFQYLNTIHSALDRLYISPLVVTKTWWTNSWQWILLWDCMLPWSVMNNNRWLEKRHPALQCEYCCQIKKMLRLHQQRITKFWVILTSSCVDS